MSKQYAERVWLGCVTISPEMASAITFDTHAYVKKLTGAGFSEEQAEVQAETLVALVEDRLATKQDLKRLESKLERDLKELEMRLVICIGALVAVAVGAVATLVKIL